MPKFAHPLQGHAVVKPRPVGALKFAEGNTGLSSYYQALCPFCGGTISARPIANTPGVFNIWETRDFKALLSHDGDRTCRLSYPGLPDRPVISVEVMSRADGPPHWIQRGFAEGAEQAIRKHINEGKDNEENTKRLEP